MGEHQLICAGGGTTSSGGCGAQAGDSGPGSAAPKPQGHTGPHRCESGGHGPVSTRRKIKS